MYFISILMDTYTMNTVYYGVHRTYSCVSLWFWFCRFVRHHLHSNWSLYLSHTISVRANERERKREIEWKYIRRPLSRLWLYTTIDGNADTYKHTCKGDTYSLSFNHIHCPSLSLPLSLFRSRAHSHSLSFTPIHSVSFVHCVYECMHVENLSETMRKIFFF